MGNQVCILRNLCSIQVRENLTRVGSQGKNEAKQSKAASEKAFDNRIREVFSFASILIIVCQFLITRFFLI